MTMSDAFLRFVHVEKGFGSKSVLRGVDLEVARGETVVVLGGSGSGKSVLLRHAVGLFHPDAGEVWVDGTELSGLDDDGMLETRKKVGMLFQSGALFDSMTVEENVGFALTEHTDWDDGKILARVEEVLGWSSSTACSTSCRRTCPAACASAWPWPERSRWPRRRSSMMSRPPAWIRSRRTRSTT
jgi:ABC-type transporter Mla maintaining outer membrane lipid asymmetry ATPase subunit MlaF